MHHSSIWSIFICALPIYVVVVGLLLQVFEMALGTNYKHLLRIQSPRKYHNFPAKVYAIYIFCVVGDEKVKETVRSRLQ